MKRRVPLIKAARVTLVVYAIALTGLVLAAVTAGPFKDPMELSAKIRILEGDLRETQIARKSLEEEKTRLLSAVRNLSQERAVLITRLNQLRQANPPQTDAKKAEKEK